MTELESRLQDSLENVYRIETGLAVADFRIDRAALQIVLPKRAEACRETLVVAESAEETYLALFICDEILAGARAFESAAETSSEDLRPHLDAICVAAEGVSYFVYFTFCGGTYDRPVSQVELELQAEIDKFLLLRLTCGLRGEDLIEALFDRFALDPKLSDEERARYRLANRIGRRYARWLDRKLSGAEATRALRDARQLYRKPMSAKIEHIERLAA